MAVPIVNMKISDILNELQEQSSNVSLRNLHLSPNVVGTGLDPNFCPGATGYDRLANLRDLTNKGGVRSFYIGKFRNYTPPTIFFRSGLHYNYWAIRAWPTSGPYPYGEGWLSHTVAIPDGWRIMITTDWLNIFKYLNSSWDLNNNHAAPFLKTNLNKSQCYYGWTAMTGNNNYNFGQLASGNFNLESTGNHFVPYRFRKFGQNYSSYIWSLFSIRYGQPYLLRFNDENTVINIISSSSLTFEKSFFAGVRLIQANWYGNYNSVDPGFVEDIEGNIYKTTKIGPYVLTSENIRTKKRYDGSFLIDYSQNLLPGHDYFDNINYFDPPGYVDHTHNDIP